VRPRIPGLVLVTDRHASAGRDLVAVVAAALDAGLPAVQLRDKDLPGGPLFALAERLRAASAQTGALLFVNDRLDVALAVGADGVHLGGGSVAADVARRLLGADALIGVSTHAPGEAPADADLAFFGPVYVTPSKGGAQGEARLAEAVRAAGAAGAAVIRAILAAPDPAAATRALLAALA